MQFLATATVVFSFCCVNYAEIDKIDRFGNIITIGLLKIKKSR